MVLAKPTMIGTRCADSLVFTKFLLRSRNLFNEQVFNGRVPVVHKAGARGRPSVHGDARAESKLEGVGRVIISMAGFRGEFGDDQFGIKGVIGTENDKCSSLLRLAGTL